MEAKGAPAGGSVEVVMAPALAEALKAAATDLGSREQVVAAGTAPAPPIYTE